MGVVKVKTYEELVVANKRFDQRVRRAQVNSLRLLASTNKKASSEIASKNKFKGVLLSMINIKTINSLKLRLISSAPHSFAIEKGQPNKRGYVTFSEEPLLEEWVRTKLAKEDPLKAQFFLKKKAVKIGERGFPFGHPAGLRFMELGFKFTTLQSNSIVGAEILKLNK